jgi:hypothetical protein
MLPKPSNTKPRGNMSAPDTLTEAQKDAERSRQRRVAADTTTECFSAA